MESLNNPNSLDLQHPNLIDTKKFGDDAFCLPMANAGTDSDRDVAIRCRVLTLLYAKDNSSAFAESVGISPTRWNNIEQSGALSRDVERKIFRKYPEVSLDWLMRGKDDGLPRLKSDELLVAFKTVAARPPAARKKKSRRAA